jgi:phosphoglucomutase
MTQLDQSQSRAARPSGAEDIYKLYAESFHGVDHLRRIQQEAQQLITQALEKEKRV